MGAELTRSSVVLDSWPVLEWIKRREPARTKFNELIGDAVSGRLVMAMTRINYGEVIYSLRKAPEIQNADEAIQQFLSAPIHIHSIDDRLVDEAVDLKSRYRFAFADAFAAALAIRLDVEVVTGDGEFRALEADGLLQLRWMGA
jgi:predicted nucleic acid-binding protein